MTLNGNHPHPPLRSDVSVIENRAGMKFKYLCDDPRNDHQIIVWNSGDLYFLTHPRKDPTITVINPGPPTVYPHTLEQKRGQLTDRIKQRSWELLGEEINVRELRLMPYIVSIMMGSQKIDPRKINQEEREILSKWRKQGHIEGGAGGLRITDEFWGICCELVKLGYVDLFDMITEAG